MLVVGESGLGKTRLVEALIKDTEPTAMRALWARCEQGGAPPYWPWMQVIRDCAAAASPDLLRTEAELGASEVALLIPERRYMLSGARPRPPSVCPDARVRLFDAITSFLGTAAAEGGLTIVLDDLHAADPASLLLLERVADELSPYRMLIVGTYCDSEARRSPVVHRLLAGVARRGRRLVLAGMDEADTGALMGRTRKDAAVVDDVRAMHQASDGNPLFVHEATRLLTEGRAIPLDLSAVIRSRIERLPAGTRGALDMAAVLGQEFDVLTLSEASGEPADAVQEVLAPAKDAGFLDEVDGSRRSFHHPAFRRTIYDGIRPSRRAELHRQAAQALERAGVDLEHIGELIQLAHHSYEAARAGDGTKAHMWCTRAGHRAMAAHAFEEACKQFGRALEAFGVTAAVDERQRYGTLVALAEATIKTGDFEGGKDAYRRALQSARALGSAEPLTSAVVAYVRQPGAATVPTSVGLVEEARSALPA